MRRIFLVLVTLPFWAVASNAGQLRQVWDLATGASTEDVFPYRVIQRSPFDVELVSGGQPGRMITVLSRNRTTVQTVAAGKAQPGVLGEAFHFTLAGNMALFLPNRAGTTYVRAFDQARGEFAEGEPFSFKSRPSFVVGEHHIAAFEQIGRRHAAFPAEKIELYILSHDGSNFTSEKVWENDQYTTVRAMNINAAGDVAAVVVQDGAPGVIMCRCQLVVASNHRATTYPLGEDLNCPESVAISPNGTSVAIGIRTRVLVYTVAKELTRTADISTDGCVSNATGNVVQLALSDDGSIGAWLLAFEGGKPPGNWAVVVRGSAGPCESVARYDFAAVRQPRVTFSQGNRLYVTAQRLSADEQPVASVFELN